MKIRPFTESDLDQVRKISKCSFSLTPFHVDDFFSKKEADDVVWEQWTRPAVDHGKNHCFVADLSGEIIGFIIYGGYKPIHEAIGKKVASIILLAVKEQFRNSVYKVGSRLVEHILEFFKKNQVSLVTVGTDLPNLAALHVYEKNGFLRVLQWSTFRYHGDQPPTGSDVWKDKVAVTAELTQKGHEIFFHPISFLKDPDLTESERSRIRKVYDHSVEEGLKSGRLTSLYFKETTSTVVLEKETGLSELTGKKIFRLNRILSLNNGALPMVLHDLIAYLHTIEPVFMLECYVEMGKESVIEALNSLSFRNVHTTITLHKTMG